MADARIADFYARYRQRFATPERRDVRIVLSKTRARAQQARRALELGGSWTAVSRRFSIDEASGAQGGKLAAQPEGTLERALDEAVFKAGRGR